MRRDVDGRSKRGAVLFEGLMADFEAIYREHHDFVWRSLYHLGVHESAVDDALQEVFLVVHRRLVDFDGRTSLRNWLYGIARRVASDHRRRAQRVRARLVVVRDPDAHPAPEVAFGRFSAAEDVKRFLDDLDDDKREVFVLAEIEGMTAPEIAEAIGANVNTVYARLRAARLRFERKRARDEAREKREARACN
jgi:RNA polymerase sigma-70 factor, ECF subfamily